LDTPTNPKDRRSDDQPPVDLTTLGYGPFSAESRLLFASPVEVRNSGNGQRSQSEEDESGVEVAMEGSDKELNNSTGDCEGGQMKSKSELHGRQK